MIRVLKNKLITARIYLSMFFVKLLNAAGFNVASISDYYSVLPALKTLRRNESRWFKPSNLGGVKYDLEAMMHFARNLTGRFAKEYEILPAYTENQKKGFGPGFTALDARFLYYILRDLQPRHYLEIGSGLSTYYSSLARTRNAEAGADMAITCIEPFPYAALKTIPGITLLEREAQDVDPAIFETLDEGNVLFIDSSHTVKIDGDVPFLFLEVLPRLRKGVVVHVHDVPFPYNVPYPPSLWIFGQQWPSFWNEAMLLQAFLAFNNVFEIVFSAPLLRHFHEDFLKSLVPEYETVEQNPNTFSSIWLRRIG